MDIIDLERKAKDGKDYYTSVLDKLNGSVFMIKNASCSANIINFLSEKFNIEYHDAGSRFLLFFNLNSEAPIKERIPKKYQKFFKL